jgi:PilZ domain
MSNKGQSANGGGAAPGRARKNAELAGEQGKDEKSMRAQASRYPDIQSAARFPIKLPVAVKGQAGDQSAETENISANGVLFQMDSDMPVGSMVDFTISFPADVVGSDNDVRVDCRGRVVRNYAAEGRRGVGVVIDEYRFQR